MAPFVSGGKIDNGPQPLSSHILYKVQWSDFDDNTLKVFESTEPFPKLEARKDVQDSKQPDTAVAKKWKRQKHAIEVVTDVKGVSAVGRAGDFDKVKTVKDISVSEVQPVRIIVSSQPLLALLRRVIDYYPDQPLSGSSVTFTEPHQALLHYHEELERCYEERSAVVADELEGLSSDVAYMHLGLILEQIQPHVENTLRRLRAQLAKPDPVISFDDLWFALKPGSDAYLLDSEIKTPMPVCVVAMEMEQDHDEKRKASWLVTCFNWESDGYSANRDKIRHRLEYFNGERPIASLDLCPAEIVDRKDGGKLRQEMVQRGKQCWDILRRGYGYMNYTGAPYYQTAEKRSPPSENGSLILDLQSYSRYGHGNDNDYIEHWSWLKNPMKGDGKKWESKDISVAKTASLTEHQYFLLQKYLPGFVIKSKKWYLFHMDQLSDITEDNQISSHLALERKQLDILQAVCEARESSWNIDFIEEKGEGSIILLHGPPGVGKTFTVETFAKEKSRPLLSLTIADIGLEDATIEGRLVKWFNMAEAWNAILLLDEADIFMEARVKGDVKRNALVSVFLRRMEYFRGVFFLTTNRIGNIDDAFLSRVSVVIGFDKLSDAKRTQIWRSFFNKLELDMARKKKEGSTDLIIEVNRYAKDYLLHDQQVKNLDWNGREIRNAFQTAIQLARFKAIQDPSLMLPGGGVEVTMEHFESVVQMSGYFKDYMTAVHAGQDESGRSRARLDREDSHTSSYGA